MAAVAAASDSVVSAEAHSAEVAAVLSYSSAVVVAAASVFAAVELASRLHCTPRWWSAVSDLLAVAAVSVWESKRWLASPLK